jgi:fumarylacetoacetate (FAA) hydrolase family protein
MSKEIEQSIKDTMDHKDKVKRFIVSVVEKLLTRAVEHDNSKLDQPELDIFAVYGPKLKNSTYGSDEYKQFLKEMDVALKHHYSANSHHPEHFENGIKGMNLPGCAQGCLPPGYLHPFWQ